MNNSSGRALAAPKACEKNKHYKNTHTHTTPPPPTPPHPTPPQARRRFAPLSIRSDPHPLDASFYVFWARAGCFWRCQGSPALVFSCFWRCQGSPARVFTCFWGCQGSPARVFTCFWHYQGSPARVFTCFWGCQGSPARVFTCFGRWGGADAGLARARQKTSCFCPQIWKHPKMTPPMPYEVFCMFLHFARVFTWFWPIGGLRGLQGGGRGRVNLVLTHQTQRVGGFKAAF